MAKSKADKNLKDIQKHAKQLKKLFGLLIKRYIKLLESDEMALKASLLSEIGSFLNQNGITLENMVKLDMLDSLRYLDGSLKGDLSDITGERQSEVDDMDFPFEVDEKAYQQQQGTFQ